MRGIEIFTNFTYSKLVNLGNELSFCDIQQ